MPSTQTAPPSGPGVPALASGYTAPASAVSPVLSDAVTQGNSITGTIEWGIFDTSNKPLIVGSTANKTSIYDTAYKKDFNVPKYPLEGGAFQSYNKVETPFEAKVTVSISGSLTQRQAALALIENLNGSLQLLNVVTPERTYTSCNIVHVDWDRNAKEGVRLIKVEIWLDEIRTSATQSVGDPAQPSGYDPSTQGPVSPTSPTKAQSAAISSAGAT